jgi:hypothetical protein
MWLPLSILHCARKPPTSRETVKLTMSPPAAPKSPLKPLPQLLPQPLPQLRVRSSPAANAEPEDAPALAAPTVKPTPAPAASPGSARADAALAAHFAPSEPLPIAPAARPPPRPASFTSDVPLAYWSLPSEQPAWSSAAGGLVGAVATKLSPNPPAWATPLQLPGLRVPSQAPGPTASAPPLLHPLLVGELLQGPGAAPAVLPSPIAATAAADGLARIRSASAAFPPGAAKAPAAPMASLRPADRQREPPLGDLFDDNMQAFTGEQG